MHVLYLNLCHATYTLDVANESRGYATMDARHYTFVHKHTNLIDLLRDTPISAGTYFPTCILLICRINIAAYNKLNMTENRSETEAHRICNIFTTAAQSCFCIPRTNASCRSLGIKSTRAALKSKLYCTVKYTY